MMVFKDQLRLETTSENIARDMSEGRFPERSEPQVVVIPEAERKTILTSEADAMVAAALREAEQNYLHLNTAAYEVWKWFETARPDLIGPRAEKLRDAVMGPRPYGVADQPASAALDKLIAEEGERAARICEALMRKGVFPEKWPDYFRVRSAGEELLATKGDQT